jgi:hypothetical protein
MLEVTVPGVESAFTADGRTRMARLVHPDGSWARATARRAGPPDVRQGGPRRLWTTLEDIRHRLVTEGSLPLAGADVVITPDGTVHLFQGRWHVALGAA